MRRNISFLLLFFMILNSCCNNKAILFVGSYAEEDQTGISQYIIDLNTGESRLLKEYKGIANPSFQVISEDKKFLYSVSEVGDPEASVYSYMIDEETFELKEINRQPTNGSSPCHLYLDKEGDFLVSANYNGSNVSFFPLNNKGELLPAVNKYFTGGDPDSERQDYPHLHCVYSSLDGRYLFANDLGTDRIYKIGINDESSVAVQLPKGEGPRHSVFHPNGKWAYVVGELSGNVALMNYIEGSLSPVQSVKADSLNAAGSADIRISQDGRFLYSSNRLQGDGIAIFSIDQRNGKLKKQGYQMTALHPRNFIISPNGKFLLCACRDSNLIQIFSINRKTGLLSPTCKDITVSQPVCLNIVSAPSTQY